MSELISEPSTPSTSARPHPATSAGKLKKRHITLFAIGGCIGASLFVGVGEVVRTAGAGAVIAYVVGGAIVYVVMRMLAEMALARPGLGSFVDHAHEGLGGWAGFAVGWMYWYFWVGVIAFEAVVAGQIIGDWTGTPSWAGSLAVMAVFAGFNLHSARSFGESESLLVAVKILTILVLIVGAVLYAAGLLPGGGVGLSNLVAAPFLVDGLGPVVQGLVIAVLSYFGTEIAATASVESEDPRRSVVRAARLAASRIVFFFVGSVVALLVVLPFPEIPVDASPFAAAFDKFGIPHSGTIIDAVVLVAVLSALNASVYACSRVLFGLAANGWAPASVTSRSARDVPRRAVLLSSLGGVLGAAINWFAPEEAFSFILNSAGAVALIVYFFICISQPRLRARLTADEIARLPIRVWFHPWLALACATALVATLAVMLIAPATRVQAALSTSVLAVVLCAYGAFHVRSRRRTTRS